MLLCLWRVPITIIIMVPTRSGASHNRAKKKITVKVKMLCESVVKTAKTIISNGRKPPRKCKTNNIIADDYGNNKKKNLPSYAATPNMGEFLLKK